MSIDENEIKAVYERMQFVCFGHLGHKQITYLFPDRAATPDEHLEFDHFLLYSDVCIIAEISGLSDKRAVKEKYERFCDSINLVRGSSNPAGVLRKFDIPQESLHLLDPIRRVSAFFIAGKHERYDVEIRELNQVPILYASDWRLICSYVESIGRYAQYPFLKLIGIAPRVDLERDLTFRASRNLLSLGGRFLFRDSNVRANVFTFKTNPRDLLEIAEVFRRELMPVIEDGDGTMYQRPLDSKKLEQMRSLVNNADFMFPNTILLALDETCHLNRASDDEQDILHIPMVYGAVSVIDGQHRLFSYASEVIAEEVRQNASILVTALMFDTQDPAVVLRCAANTFVEINQTQKKISSAHIDEIAYSVLGRTYPRALAAQVIFRANRRPSNKSLSGLFRSRQTTGGVIEAATVISVLHPFTNLNAIQKLVRSQRNVASRRGYLKILTDTNLQPPTTAEELIDNTMILLEAYFDKVRRVFSADWAALRNRPIISALSYTKVFAAFVRLFKDLIYEGLNSSSSDGRNQSSWQIIQAELEKIKSNIEQLRQSQSEPILFSVSDSQIPTDSAGEATTLKFLKANRKAPMSVQEVMSTETSK